ncbi:serine/threonine-protein kinase [Brevifollis gellanilyticus]|uniref:Protein kinase domain-containing protein n=1 Tax=Brevifollis gellanilyticus TaxID=748831 RepID=A0A512M992_9BACT|nr:serine/threonine-protein kinase [Brevifollis gellanilyticus]GEP43295.1 hypothetical protein BGE01nite_25860 [Brevifollis gellanilyticus]
MAERYKIYEQLGAGGVGAVYRAYDNELKRWVAIKRLMSANDISGDEKLTADLRREADALASMRNPNIVTIFDVASDAEGLFMVMELLEGEDLADVVARGPLHYDDFKELANQALEALLGAHQRHILHRDIKPENIKVERLPGGRMQSKIIDFGLARAGMRARKQTEDQSGTVMGSIHYMAPEQLTRRPVDDKTDLYSLGCVFYEALSGRKAFDGDSVATVIDKHINHDLVPLHIVAPHVPPWLGAWVMRLMACKPEDRPVNAQQAIEEFRAWEKMASAPQIMPWMPMGYGQMPVYPQYGTGGVPMATPTTSSVPVQPMYYSTGQVPAYGTGQVPPVYQTGQVQAAYATEPVPLEAIPVAEPIIEVGGFTQQLPSSSSSPAARRTPSKPVGSTRLVGGHRGPAAPPKHAAAKSSGSNGLKIALVAAGVIALGAAAFFLTRGAGEEKRTPSPAPSVANDDSGKTAFELPMDRAYPPADADLCLHLVANTGLKKADGKGASEKDIVTQWHDLSPRGKDNYLRALDPKADMGPRRSVWASTPANVAGPNGGRSVLDFHARSGKGSAMQMNDPGGEKNQFPFGSAAPKQPKGMTLSFVAQADGGKLPTNIMRLSGDGGNEVVVSVDNQKRVVAAVRGDGNSSASLTTKDVNPTIAFTVTVTWDAGSGEVILRVKDATGKTNEVKGTASAPKAPLYKLQIGAANAGADQFSGWLADVLLYASVPPLNNLQQLQGTVLHSYYMHGVTAPKPTAPAAKK